jgi:hypothetical protein
MPLFSIVPKRWGNNFMRICIQGYYDERNNDSARSHECARPNERAPGVLKHELHKDWLCADSRKWPCLL